MFIALENLFNGGVKSVPLCYEFDFSAQEFGGVFPFTTPVRLEGEIRNTAGIVEVDAKISFVLETRCDRCAADVKLPFEVKMEHGLVSSLNDEENDDYILVEDMRLDIEELTSEDIYLALPGKILCKEDCKGVCMTCGADLNDGPCGCEKAVDPRWAGLID